MNVAAVDIGTNSVRLLITDERGQEIERRMQITRLGEGVDRTGALSPYAITRTVAVLSEYGAQVKQHAVTRIRAVATSAARDADNSSAFFDAAERALSVRPELLSGEDEASLSFRGATDGVDNAQAPFLVIDIGGGSTEFVLGSSAPEALISVPMGCVRMTERHLTSDPPTGEPPTSDQLERCMDDARTILAEVRRAVPVQRARRVIGLAGTVTTLASLALGLRSYDPSRTHHFILRRAQVEELFTRLSTASVEARRAMLTEPKRAEVIVGGAAVLVAILRDFGLDELMVSESDILDGLAASLR
jgi:exopolyphosphatase/guanosine-5'-triphosphate,3'-diphosphate pyrophosphatase